jgi:Ca2+-binding RTX toxin-like protein
MNTRTGDTVYGFNSTADRDQFDFTKTPAPIAAIWDAGGIDTIDASGYATEQLIDLTAGSLSSIGGVTFDTAPSFEQVLANRTAAGISNATYTRAVYDGNMAALKANPAVGQLVDNFGIAYGVTIENAIGGSGNDILVGNDVANVLDGRGGLDIASYRNSTTAVTGSLVTNTVTGGHATGDTLLNIEGLEGGTVADVLEGNSGNNILSGLGGDDDLKGLGGDDILVGGAGADKLDGGEGFDTASFRTSAVGVTVTVSDLGAISASGDGVGDTYTSIEAVEGSNFNDTITGGALGDTLSGLLGNDVIDGAGGNDVIDGGQGNDTLTGGAGADTLRGGNGADVLIGGADADVIDGGDGVDTVSFRTAAAGVIITIGDTGAITATGDGAGDTYANIEVIEGSNFADTITGGALADTLSGIGGDDRIEGGEGNDVLDGGAGVDTLLGGANDDTLIGGAGADVLDGGEGFDVASYRTSLAGITLTTNSTTGAYVVNGDGAGDTFTGIEAIEGSGLADSMTGGAGADNFRGGAGNDTIDGGAGNDIMAGGLGNDTLVVRDAGDIVIEAVGEGTDTVASFIDYTLTANVETLVLQNGTAIRGTGNELANTIQGNANDNLLEGGAGNDTLNGLAGADTMVGGLGNDIMVVDNVGDVVIELAGEGTDQVNTSIDYTLAANVENLILTTGSAALRGTGNDLANIIQGNAAANTLQGLVGNDDLRGLDGNDRLEGGEGNDRLDGGNGDDTMLGGTGDDTYVVGQVLDVVTENENEGTDLVQAAITYTLGAHVENLTLTGTLAINGIGNGGANVINGNGLANLLQGMGGDDVLFGGNGDDTLEGGEGNDSLAGGEGADRMSGGVGDDTYFASDASDVVTELAGEGTDLVNASVDHTLSANVENLTLLGVTVRGTGNDLANVITGNNVANRLEGMGGNDTLDGRGGADAMFGGAGDDTYIVSDAGDTATELAGEGVDTVLASVDFQLSDHVENLTLSGAAVNGGGNGSANVITGNALANTLSGGGGDDSLFGLAGNDVLIGGEGADKLDGGEGDDLASYRTALAGLTASLASQIGTGDALGDTYASIENLEGSAFGDKLEGDGNANTLFGLAGNDELIGGGGNDRLNGGTGGDKMSGGLGNDAFVVDDIGDLVNELLGEGTDVVESSINYTLTVNVENLILTGGALTGTGNDLDNVIAGNDLANTLNGGRGNDTLRGGKGNDALDGSSGDDRMFGEDGDDRLDGGSGDDWLIGGAGADTLLASAGNDILDGGAGKDVMTGGSGKDVFVFQSASDITANGASDTITDFTSGFDKIDLSAIYDTVLFGGFTFGSSTLKANGVSVYSLGGKTFVVGDITNDGIADFSVELSGTQRLKASDFIMDEAQWNSNFGAGGPKYGDLHVSDTVLV